MNRTYFLSISCICRNYKSGNPTNLVNSFFGVAGLKGNVSFLGHTSAETVLVSQLNTRSKALQGSVDVAGEYPDIPPSEYQIKLSPSDKELLRKLDMEHRAKLVKQKEREQEESPQNTVGEAIKEQQAKVAAVPNPKAKLKVRQYFDPIRSKSEALIISS